MKNHTLWRASVCVCLMRCKMTYLVYNFDAENCTSCLLCSDFYLWFCSELACALIHMYSCMMYMSLSALSLQADTDLSLSLFVIISQSWPVEKPPNIIFFATHFGLFPSTITCVCVCLWCGLLLLNTLISLHERCSNPVSKHMHLTLSVHHNRWPATDLSSLMFGDNIYVGYVLKVPPVSYFFLYIK